LPTKAEILEKYRQMHDDITRQFYVDKTLDQTAFQTEHSKCWSNLQQELLDNGFVKPQYVYTFGVVVRDREVTVDIVSLEQLTETQITNTISEIKNADWKLLASLARLVEA